MPNKVGIFSRQRRRKQFIISSENKISSEEQQYQQGIHLSLGDDLTAQESRYKVVAKPVPYKPKQPAPQRYDSLTYGEANPASTTSTTERTNLHNLNTFKPAKNFDKKKKSKSFRYNDADVIYPTTTYRPQKFQLSELLGIYYLIIFETLKKKIPRQ